MRVPYWYVKGEMLSQEEYKYYLNRIQEGVDPDTILKKIKADQEEARKSMLRWFVVIMVVCFIGMAMA